jgi:hypothetical protein
LQSDKLDFFSKLPNEIRTLPKIAKMVNQVYIPLWAKKINENGFNVTAIFDSLPLEAKTNPKILEAIKKTWIAQLQSPTTNFKEIIGLFQRLPEEADQVPEIKFLQNKKLIPAWIAYIRADPLSIRFIPQNIRQNPEFIKAYKTYIISLFNALHPNIPNSYQEYILPELINDPAIQKATKKFNWEQRGAFGTNWYSLYKQSYSLELPKTIDSIDSIDSIDCNKKEIKKDSLLRLTIS